MSWENDTDLPPKKGVTYLSWLAYDRCKHIPKQKGEVSQLLERTWMQNLEGGLGQLDFSPIFSHVSFSGWHR